MQRPGKKEKKIINGRNFRIALIISEFNRDITEKMLEGAIKTLKKNLVQEKNIKIIWVPGSFEIPLMCQKMAKMEKIDGIVAIGCVIKGETDHFYYISSETSRGIMDVMLKFSIPIGFGIITCNNLKQAKDRSGIRENKGIEATQAVLEMLSI